MSISLMTSAWKASLPSTRKIVLLALCDNSNDQGECYPSIQTIAMKCSMTDRGVFKCLKDLERDGYLKRESRLGRSTIYHVTNPCTWFTPEHCSPLNNIHPTPEHCSPTPEHCSPITITKSSKNLKEKNNTKKEKACPPVTDFSMRPEKSMTSPEGVSTSSLNFEKPKRDRDKCSLSVEKPESVPDGIWRDFIALRKAKKAPLTLTALRGIDREAKRAGISISDAFEHCCERGWQGFRSDWFLESKSKPRPDDWLRDVR